MKLKIDLYVVRYIMDASKDAKSIFSLTSYSKIILQYSIFLVLSNIFSVRLHIVMIYPTRSNLYFLTLSINVLRLARCYAMPKECSTTSIGKRKILTAKIHAKEEKEEKQTGKNVILARTDVESRRLVSEEDRYPYVRESSRDHVQ